MRNQLSSIVILLLTLLFFGCNLEKIVPDNLIDQTCPNTVSFSIDQDTCITPCTINITNTTESKQLFEFEWFVNDSAVSTNPDPRSFVFDRIDSYEIKLIGICKSNSLKFCDSIQVINIENKCPKVQLEVEDNVCIFPCSIEVSNITESKESVSFEWYVNDSLVSLSEKFAGWYIIECASG